MYLADGGIINNLATQAAREDHIVSGATEKSLPILCINASAPESTARRWPFLIPLLSQITSLSRMVKILLANTITSREREATRANLVRQYSQRRPGKFDPLDVLVSIISTPTETLEQLKGHAVADAYDRTSMISVADSDPKVVRWTKGLLRQLNEWASKAEDSKSDAELLSMIKKSIDRRPKGSSWAPGFIEADLLENLKLPGSLPVDVSHADAPTTLGRVQKDKARGLMFQGYVNTALASLVLRSDRWTQFEAWTQFFDEENLSRVLGRISHCTEQTQDSRRRGRRRSRGPSGELL